MTANNDAVRRNLTALESARPALKWRELVPDATPPVIEDEAAFKLALAYYNVNARALYRFILSGEIAAADHNAAPPAPSLWRELVDMLDRLPADDPDRAEIGKLVDYVTAYGPARPPVAGWLAGWE